MENFRFRVCNWCLSRVAIELLIWLCFKGFVTLISGIGKSRTCKDSGGCVWETWMNDGRLEN